MFRRVSVIGDKKFVQSLEKCDAGPNVLFQTLEGQDHPLPSTAAVLVSGNHVSEGLDAALNVALQHEDLLRLLADAIGAREDLPAGDADRLRIVVGQMAQALQLSADDQFALERAAYLRDIGKLRIPNSVLLKKSVLDYDEWTLLKNHSRLGAQLLAERNVCTDVAAIVEFHHECYDGDGYPDHLEREEIPFLARVMRLADVYCAMTSPRFYRSSHHSHQEAVEYLLAERGKHFDPALVDVFVAANIGAPTSPSN